MNNAAIETERLTLRRFVPEDIDNLHGLLSNPDVMRYYSGPLTRQDGEKWLEGILRDHETNGFGMFAVCLKETGEFIGQAGVMRRQSDDGQVVHYVGYMICPKLWGQGYASEAARAVVGNALEKLGAEKITALVDPANERSIHVLEKLGLQLESTTQHAGREHLVYTLTK